MTAECCQASPCVPGSFEADRPIRSTLGQQRVERRLELVGLDIFRRAINLPVDAGERELLARRTSRAASSRRPAGLRTSPAAGNRRRGRPAVPMARRRPTAAKGPETSTPAPCRARRRPAGATGAGMPELRHAERRQHFGEPGAAGLLRLAQLAQPGLDADDGGRPAFRRDDFAVGRVHLPIFSRCEGQGQRSEGRRRRRAAILSKCKTPVTLRPGAPSTRRERRECRISVKGRERCSRLFQ